MPQQSSILSVGDFLNGTVKLRGPTLGASFLSVTGLGKKKELCGWQQRWQTTSEVTTSAGTRPSPKDSVEIQRSDARRGHCHSHRPLGVKGACTGQGITTSRNKSTRQREGTGTPQRSVAATSRAFLPSGTLDPAVDRGALESARRLRCWRLSIGCVRRSDTR